MHSTVDTFGAHCISDIPQSFPTTALALFTFLLQYTYKLLRTICILREILIIFCSEHCLYGQDVEIYIDFTILLLQHNGTVVNQQERIFPSIKQTSTSC
jgi:hypothetical protein